tara:strand:- start:8038 stop:8757 length:720 start_codon:yes stop_codon:yes gene_type:complete
MTELNFTITKEVAKRLVHDIRNISINPLHKEGIYYKHDTENMLKGYAMIIGPEYGLYANGIYFFTFKFPTDYPFSPPIVEYWTNDGTTRFNPNLYRQGKVCLSILNTWDGEPWTSCQSIRSVLLNLLLLFNEQPLLNEPGVTKVHPDFVNYHKIIEYKNIDFSIYYQLTQYKDKYFNLLFKNEIKEHITKNIDDIYNKCLSLEKIYPKQILLKTNLYKMSTIIDYPTLCKNILLIKEIF